MFYWLHAFPRQLLGAAAVRTAAQQVVILPPIQTLTRKAARIPAARPPQQPG